MSIENYMPDYAIESVYDLTVENLEMHNIEVVLVDLDNTLIAWNQEDGTPEMQYWIDNLNSGGIKVIVVSNNTKKRVERAVGKLGLDYIAWAMKPFSLGINKVLERYNLEKENVVMVGDQLVTDVRAARRVGIRSILVRPLDKYDSIKTKINRVRERKLLKKIEKKYGKIVHTKGI